VENCSRVFIDITALAGHVCGHDCAIALHQKRAVPGRGGERALTAGARARIYDSKYAREK